VNAVVTGGGGFLGLELVRQLRARGDQVTVIGRNTYPAVEALGARSLVADLSASGVDLRPLVHGADVVFHTAAKAGVWGPRAEYQNTNVVGTRRILDAAKAAGVPAFVHTSSPSCTFDGTDHEGVTEDDVGYPTKFEAFYPESKAMAERVVLPANADGFRTTALRPHLIWGPGDPHLLPRIVARNRQGRLRIVGDGTNKVGITTVQNAAAAHVQAADALRSHARNAGNAYFVTDPEPVVLWAWLNAMLEKVGEKPVTRRVSVGTARFAGNVLERVWTGFSLGGEPPMTRFVASQLATSHWYDLKNGRADFGLAPVVDPAAVFEDTARWLRETVR
jgi:nucleoside-diphosphate-sugar epimerase